MSRSPTAGEQDEVEAYRAGWRAVMRLVREGRSWSGHERARAFLGGCGQRFADASGLSGLDAPEDGRAMALVDWDRDGDVDVWLRNRTGPRLRLMLNQAGSLAGDSVALRLEGVTGNRDAVGARVEVIDASGRRAVRGVRAGSGFLSRSSRWLHVGLGGEGGVRQVTVRWPGGETEPFEGVEAGGRYVLRQGTGLARPMEDRASPTLPAADLPPDEPSGAARVRLSRPVPFPSLDHLDRDGRPASTLPGGGPRLVNLWASWCKPCGVELRELQARTDALGEAGVEVLALSVETAEANGATGPDDARAFLDDIGFRHPTGFAPSALLDRIDLLQEALFDRVPAFGVPTSFLLDGAGRLAAVYRGSVAVDTMLKDAASLGRAPSDPREAALPFAGRWIAPPPSHPARLRVAAERFHEAYPDDALRLLRAAAAAADEDLASADDEDARIRAGHDLVESRKLLAGLLESLSRETEAVDAYRAALAVSPENTDLHRLLGSLLSRLGRTEEALVHLRAAGQAAGDGVLVDTGRALEAEGRYEEALAAYRRAVEQEPDNPRAHFRLGYLLARAGETDDAIAAYVRSLEIDAGDVEVISALGVAWSSQGRLRDAARAFALALELRPDLFRAALNLGLSHHGLGDLEEARAAYERAVEIDPASAEAHFNLGRALRSLGRTVEAIAELHEARRLDPSDPGPPSRLAWILATAAEDSVRDPAEAVRLAEEGAALAREAARRDGTAVDPLALDALAAAYAAAGRFDEAVAVGEEAAKLADATGDLSLAAALWKRWVLYRDGKPYRLPR